MSLLGENTIMLKTATEYQYPQRVYSLRKVFFPSGQIRSSTLKLQQYLAKLSILL